MLVATAVAGASGYVVTVLAGAVLGHDGYIPFASFWSVLYFVVGALAGVQHEVTRASRAAPAGQPTRTTARSIFFAAGASSLALLTVLGWWWIPRGYVDHGVALAVPTVVGAIGYLAISVGAGVLAGLASWRTVAWITAADALTRLTLVSVALHFTRDVAVLAWCVAAPFGIVGLAVAWFVTRRVRGRYVIKETLPQVLWNASRTVASGAAMGVLITGFPAILAATSVEADASRVASLIFVSNLFRSPLIVIVMAFQGMLVQRLRDSDSAWHLLRRLLGSVCAVGAVLTVGVTVFGPWALRVVFGGEYTLGAGDIALLVGSAVPTSAMFIVGAAVLSQGRHGTYLAGWIAAASTSVLGLVTLPLFPGVVVATAGAPLVGTAVHLMGQRRRMSEVSTSAA